MNINKINFGSSFAYALGVFTLGSIIYWVIDRSSGNITFLAQALVLPAQFFLALISKVLLTKLNLEWLDVDVSTTSAMIGRSIAFGLTALMVYVPAQLYRSRRTRLTLVLAIAPWLFIALTMMLFAILLIGMEQSWGN